MKCLWYDRRDAPPEGADLHVLPDGYAEIIFHFGGAYLAPGHPLPSPCIVGLLAEPLKLHARGRLDILAVRCYPWAVFDLLGIPPETAGVRALAHPIAELQPTLARRIHEDRIDVAVADLAAYLLSAQPRLDSVLSRAGAALRDGHGTLPVRDVAAAAHATVRTLERKFRRSSGHTVKDISSLMRFEQVRNRLVLQPAANLAALARELGYTDQSHLHREFKRFSGTTPAAFARRQRVAPILSHSYKSGPP
ncbi:helix-turn-helix domain-containing protein [Pseudoduganella flava]|uniref:helix-turn-helix domain-containing protein n=1 Tax=Pseudoduganella flava TaxID=871742 RepID=UPI0018EF35A5|nr:helix-turn-helix domain-containing protein [Pseudoduganella flava]